MDHLLMLVIAGGAFGGWLHAMWRPMLAIGWKVAAPAALLVVGGYFIVEALRSRGVWISGEAQCAWWVAITMGLGLAAGTGALDERHDRQETTG